MKKITAACRRLLNNPGFLKSIPLLLMRLVLAFGFFTPAKMKWSDIGSIAEWFGSMGIPAPTLSAYLAAGTEAAGVIMLALGLGTRIISIPLIITMGVAIKTVHWANGFEAGENGFEIPLYYIIMLLTLLVFGAGQWSLDHIIGKKYRNRL
ncbi:MAG: DoxX family protein [Sphingobacteriales bacterium]|nr:DoxX family protein [Sphingobacteriales bacterium]